MLPNVVVAISCWYERHCDVLREVHSPLVVFCLTIKSFCFFFLIAFACMICLNDVFLRNSMSGVALNTSPNVLLMSNICQCLLIYFLTFTKFGLFVRENAITCFSVI